LNSLDKSIFNQKGSNKEEFKKKKPNNTL